MEGHPDAPAGLVHLLDSLRLGLPHVSHGPQELDRSACGYATR